MNKLLQDYIHFASEHGKMTLDGNSKKGNRIHRKLMKVIELIKQENDNVRGEFYALMHHEDDSVRMWTATTLLKTFEKEALETLDDIRLSNKSIYSLTAATTIDIWKRGLYLLKDLIDWNKES